MTKIDFDFEEMKGVFKIPKKKDTAKFPVGENGMSFTVRRWGSADFLIGLDKYREKLVKQGAISLSSIQNSNKFVKDTKKMSDKEIRNLVKVGLFQSTERDEDKAIVKSRELDLEFVAQVIVLDWENFNNKKGEPVPYSPEAFMYFCREGKEFVAEESWNAIKEVLYPFIMDEDNFIDENKSDEDALGKS